MHNNEETNPILEELHKARQKILADWNEDTGAYLRNAQIRLEQSGRTVWKEKTKIQHPETIRK